MAIPDSSDPSEPAVSSDRRGKPVEHVSYFSRRQREQRADLFKRRERGQSVRSIAAELGLDVHDVEETLLSDRRRRTR